MHMGLYKLSSGAESEQKHQSKLKIVSTPMFSDGAEMTTTHSNQDPPSLSPSLIMNTTSAFVERKTTQTDDKQDRNSVLTLEEASGHNADQSGDLFDELEFSGEFTGHGVLQDDAYSFETFSLADAGEFTEDSNTMAKIGTDDPQFSTSGFEFLSSTMDMHHDGAGQRDSPLQRFSPFDEAVLSDDLAWDLTNDDEVDPPFSTFPILGTSEERLEQAMNGSQSFSAESKKIDSGSGTSSQSEIGIVDIDILPITPFFDQTTDDMVGSGEIENEAAASYGGFTDTIYGDNVISSAIPASVPTAPEGCSGRCDDSKVESSVTDEMTQSLLMVTSTTRQHETQIDPPATLSAIKVHVDYSGAGDDSAQGTDVLDENTPTAEISGSNLEVISTTEQPIPSPTEFLGSINNSTVVNNMTTVAGVNDQVDLPPVSFRGMTVLDTQDVSAEGNDTILSRDPKVNVGS